MAKINKSFIVAAIVALVVCSVLVSDYYNKYGTASDVYYGYTADGGDAISDNTHSAKEKMDVDANLPMPQGKPSQAVDTITKDARKDANRDWAKEEGGIKSSTQQMIIKTGQLYMVVPDVRDALQKITSYANGYNGYIVSSQLSKSGVAPSGSITIRIPMAVYDTGLNDVKMIGEVQSENSTGQDVTSEYVDLESHIKNLRATESQLLEIMKRAGQISDVLNVQAQLSSVRDQIEQIQGQMKYLRDSASMSSLTVYLSTDPSALPLVEASTDSWKPVAEVKNAFRSLLSLGKTISYGLIWLVIYIPLWLLIVVGIWFIVKVIKRISLRFAKRHE